MPTRVDECIIRLTEEEALGLLELALSCPVDLSPDQRTAIIKLGDYCRECLRSHRTEPVARDSASVAKPLPNALAA